MQSQAMFLNCPAYLDNDGATRCGLPAEVDVRYVMSSTSGPLESAKIRCPLGHWFNGPIEFLTVPQPQPRYPGIVSLTGRQLSLLQSGQAWQGRSAGEPDGTADGSSR